MLLCPFVIGDGMAVHFRFQDLDIWKRALDVGDNFFDIADALERKKLFRFADQARGVGLSITNNIAEGCGSTSSREFTRYLTIARSSVFEGANIAIVLHRRKLIGDDQRENTLKACDQLARMISGFKSSLFR